MGKLSQQDFHAFRFFQKPSTFMFQENHTILYTEKQDWSHS